MYYILLDEVQLVSEFEDVLNSYLQVKNVDVYVTGSNARFLSKDVITEFRGRGFEVRVHPLSFMEVQKALREEPIEQLWEKYLTFGGLPLQTRSVSPILRIFSNILTSRILKNVIISSLIVILRI